MEIFRIAAIGIITALCVLVLRENRSDIATLIGITGGVIILLSLIDYFTQIFDFLRRFIEKTGIDGSVIKALVKIVGIGYVADFSAGIVEESGSKALSEKIVLGGKVIIFIMSIPTIEMLFEIISSML